MTGEPGSGKSSLLEIIVAAKEDAGPYGAPRFLSSWIRPGEAAAKITATWHLDEEEQAEVGGDAFRVHETIVDPTTHAFTPRGRHSLKGVPGDWDLYAVDTDAAGSPPG